MSTPRLLIAVACLLAGVACTVKGDRGPAGPAGPAGARGAAGAAAPAALIRSAPVAAGAKCANGGTRIDVGTDTNGNGVLDDAEVTGSSYLCDGPPGPQGPAGPASAWELVAGDGFVYGRTTGYAGWLWNDAWKGFVAMPAAQAGGTGNVLTSPPGLRVYFHQVACDDPDAYLKTDDYGTAPLLKGMIVAVPWFNIDKNSWDPTAAVLYRLDSLTPVPATTVTSSEIDFPSAKCTNLGTGPSTPLDRLTYLIGPAGYIQAKNDAVQRIHPGPLTLRRVPLP